MADRIPVIVLAGSDRRPGPVPRQLEASDMLGGFKGALRLPWGRCLAGELIERLKSSERFQSPILVGPNEVYQGNVDCEIVDVSGNLGTTLACVRELIHRRFRLSSPIAFSTCDILPTPEEIRQLLSECYDPHSDSMFWGELIAAERKQMGASRWKPSYHFRPGEGQPPTNLYPGHLVIARPDALRMRLTNHLLQLAYVHRNLNIRRRHFRMLARGWGRLFAEDFQNLFSGQWPLLSVSIPYHCLRAYYQFRRGQLTVPQFAQHVSKVFLHRDYHHRVHDASVVFSITQIVSFAKDIDTKAELAEAQTVQP